MGALEKMLDGRQFIAGNRFTAADLFVGAMVNFMIGFKLLQPRPAFTDYAARTTDRDAYRRATAIDAALVAEEAAKAPAQQPA
jgi:glutathione S-transferase